MYQEVTSFDLSATEPPISVIIPYCPPYPFYPLSVCENDEVLIVEGGESIGDARIKAAEEAKFDWLVFLDADAVYPHDFILQVKRYINQTGYPILGATRTGGFGNLFWNVLESGLIVRKDIFLAITEKYVATDRRSDVADFFVTDVERIPVEYYHDFTHGESTGLSLLLTLGAIATLLWLSYKNIK